MSSFLLFFKECPSPSPSRPPTEQDIYLIQQLVFPYDENYFNPKQEGDKCNICNKHDEIGGLCRGKKWVQLVGYNVCKCCYQKIPRLARMKAKGYYKEEAGKFAYVDPTCYREEEDKKKADILNAEALLDYKGFQPDWNSPLTREWIQGYYDDLRKFRRAILQVVEKGELNDPEVVNTCKGVFDQKKV